MKRTSSTGAVVATLLALTLLATGVIYAQMQPLDSQTVASLAVYMAHSGSSDSWPDSQVNYTVTDPAEIDAIFSGIEFGIERDCTDLETKDSTHLYVKFHDGSRKVFNLFLGDSHIALTDRRDPCFWVNDSARALLISHAQI